MTEPTTFSEVSSNQWRAVVVRLYICIKVASVPAFKIINADCFCKISGIPYIELRRTLVSKLSHHSYNVGTIQGGSDLLTVQS